MPIRQQIFALIICMVVFFFTVDMVRRRRLREEYSVLWLCTSLVMFFLVLQYDSLVSLTHFIGAGLPTTTLFIGSIIFLMLIAVQFSIKISQLANQVKDLAQDNALLREELVKQKWEKGAVRDGGQSRRKADGRSSASARTEAI